MMPKASVNNVITAVHHTPMCLVFGGTKAGDNVHASPNAGSPSCYVVFMIIRLYFHSKSSLIWSTFGGNHRLYIRTWALWTLIGNISWSTVIKLKKNNA